MAISEAQRQAILEYTGQHSLREIARKVGVSVNTVRSVQATADTPPTSVSTALSPSPARKTAPVSKVYRNTDTLEPLHLLGQRATAAAMVRHLESELELYERAKSAVVLDPELEWAVVQHGKLVNSILRDIGKWCGLDKGILNVNDPTENVSEFDVQKMSLEDMLKLVSKL
jgi:Sigma-70, region 4.